MMSRIKFSEVGEDERLNIHQLINYFQDCSTFHLTDLNIDLQKMKIGFYMLSWQIELNKLPKLGESVKIVTFMHEGKGAFGYRNYLLYNEQNEVLAYANMSGCFIHTENGSLMKLTKAQHNAYPLGEKLEMDYLPRKIITPEFKEVYPEILVSKCHIDIYHHVNNAQYVAIALNYLPQDLKYTQLRVEYKQAAKLNDQLIPMTVEENGIYYISLCNEQHQPYVVLAFSIKDA